MEKDFVTVNIGRNTPEGVPMNKEEWLEFQRLTRDVLTARGEVVGYGTGTSEYNGVKETFATFHVLTNRHINNKAALAQLARYFSQETIAYVISTPDSLVKANEPLNQYL